MRTRLFIVMLFCGLAAGPARAQEDDLAQARGLLERGRYRAAYDLLRPPHEAGHREPQRLRLLGRAALGLGRPGEAVSFFEAVLAAGAGTARDHQHLAWARYEQARGLRGGLAKAAFLDAADAARQAVTLEPKRLVAWQYLAAALAGAGEAARARAAYEEGIKAMGGEGKKLVLDYAAFLGRQGQIDAALAALDPLLQAAPDDADAKLVKARLRADAGRVDQAVRLFREILRRSPDHRPTYDEVWARLSPPAYRAQGIALLREVLKVHPQQLTARGYLGNFLRVAGDESGAEAAYKKCLEIKRDYAWAHRALAELYREEARTLLARVPIDRVRVRERLLAGVRSFLRYVDYAAAQETLDTSLIPAVDRLIYDLAREGRDPVEAYKAEQVLLARFPALYDLHHTAGLICQDLGKFEEGEAAITRALALCPADDTWSRALYTVNLGLLYEGWNKYGKARQTFEKAAQMEGPAHLDALENLGKLHYKLGSYKKAIAHFKAVLDEDPQRSASLFYYHLCRRLLQRKTYFRRR